MASRWTSATLTAIDRSKSHDLDVVVDRIVVREGVKGRLTDSVELALKLGDGTLLVDATDGSEPLVMSERLVSWEFGITLPPLEPRLFSFNSPHGACPTCDGLGVRSTVDVGRVVPDPSRSLREGAVLAFGRRGSVATATEVARVVELLHVSPDAAWKDLPEEQREAILQRHAGAQRQAPRPAELRRHRHAARAHAGGEGASPKPRTRKKATRARSAATTWVASSSTRTCPACNGVRLRPEALAVRVADKTIAELCAMPLRTLREFLNELGQGPGAHGPRRGHRAAAVARGDGSGCIFLLEIGLDYLSLDRAAHSLSRRRGAAHPARDPDRRLSLVGVLYVLDEPSIGLHARDNERLLLALRRLVDKGNSELVVEHDRDAILAGRSRARHGPRRGHQRRQHRRREAHAGPAHGGHRIR